jgi:hypothetical protein
MRLIPSLRSKLLLGYKVPLDGALSREHPDHLSPAAYRCGAIYGIRRRVPAGGVDVFLAGSRGGASRRTTGRASSDGSIPPPSWLATSKFSFARLGPIGFSLNVDLAALARRDPVREPGQHRRRGPAAGTPGPDHLRRVGDRPKPRPDSDRRSPSWKVRPRRWWLACERRVRGTRDSAQ